MRKGMIFSGLLHVAIVALALFGLPDLWRKAEISSQAIPVELVDIGELTNAPPPQAEQQAEAKAERAELKPMVRPAPQPPPEPEEPKLAAPVVPPEPKEEAKKPEPEPEPKEEAKKPEPEPEPEPEKPVAQQAQATERPKRRPKPPQPDFESVLKTVQSLKRQQETREAPEPQRQTASTANARSIPDQPLTISELDAIRRQFISCWNVDVGAPGIEEMMVSIRVELNPDRTVRQAQFTEHGNLSNSHYRSFAESALRAVRNPRCSPVKLPPKKFEAMKTFTLRFSAKEMLGL